MSIIAYFVVGLSAGWLARQVMKGGYGFVDDIIIGIGGALLGGFLAGRLFGGDFISGINITTLLVAFVAAVSLIAMVRMLPGRARV